MKKITTEFIRLGLAFFAFVIIMILLFAYVNHIDSNTLQFFGELVTIPVIILIALIPVWMIYDLIKKNVADKPIFNLTFFVSLINIFLLAFAIIYLN